MSKSHTKKIRLVSTTAEKVEVDLLKKRVEKIVEDKPKKAAKILSLWLHSKHPKTKKQKAS